MFLVEFNAIWEGGAVQKDQQYVRATSEKNAERTLKRQYTDSSPQHIKAVTNVKARLKKLS